MKSIPILFALLTTGFVSNLWAGEVIDEQMSASDVSVINIENIRGSVTINGSDNNEITAVGELGEHAKKFVFERSGNMVLIKVDYESHKYHGSNNRDGSHFTVTMPKNVRMNFESISADVMVTNLNGSAEVKTVSGNINATNVTESINFNTVSGDIDTNNLSGKVRLSTVSGDIDDKNSSGRLKLKVVSGEIKTHSQAREVSLGAVSGDIDFRLNEVDDLMISNVSGNVKGSLTLLDHGEVKMSGVSSDIALEFQDGVNADFRLNASAGGDIVNRITRDKATRAKYGPSSELDFVAGSGTATVRGSVVSGEIKVTAR
ncbi:DUF4097 family beta strand repeat-containing protein [Colwellia sp. MEBiC06753]